MIDLKQGYYVGPAIKLIENAVENCDELIEIGKSMDGWNPAGLGGNSQIDASIRKCHRLSLPMSFDMPKEFFALGQQLHHYGLQYAEEAGVMFSEMEVMQMLHYEVDDGFYNPHYDSMPMAPREFSAVLYLNDVAEGGNTTFLNFDIGFTPEKGSLILFPANFAYVHDAAMPKSNDKYAIVTWYRSVIDSSLTRKCKCDR